MKGKLSRESILITRPFSALPILSLICDHPSKSATAACPGRGDFNCWLYARSLQGDIPPSCFSRAQVFISNEIDAVLDLRNICRSPAISPDKLRTTVAIIERFMFPSETMNEAKYGIINPYLYVSRSSRMFLTTHTSDKRPSIL